MTRDEFNSKFRQEGGLRVRVRLLREDEGGRSTPLSGESEYRANWSIDSRDPDHQMGAPMLIDTQLLLSGDEGAASLIRLFPDTFSGVEVSTRLTAFEGTRAVAEAVVTEVVAAENSPA